jgi:hypothetical protein
MDFGASDGEASSASARGTFSASYGETSPKPGEGGP